MLNRKSVIRAALAMVAGLGIASSSWAGSAASGSIAVSTTVASKCTISTPTVAFIAYDGVVTNLSTDLQNGSNSFSVNCTNKATGVKIALNFGNNFTGSQRAMKNMTTLTAAVLNYNVYQPAAASGGACSYTTLWGDGTTGTMFVPSEATWGAGVTNTKTFALCASVAAGQNPEVGTYNDTLIATINF